MDHLDIIDKYLKGELNPLEKAAFEKRLIENANFKSEYDLVNQLKGGINHHQKEKIKDKVSSIHNNLKEQDFFKKDQSKLINMEQGNNQKKKNGKMRILYLAAALAFLVGALFFMNKEKTSSNTDLMATCFKKNTQQVDDIIANLVSFGMADTEKNKKDSLKLAMESYKKGDFSSSQKVLSEYLTRYGEDNTARYYLGLNMMNMGKYADAVKQFTTVEQDKNFEQMHWLKYNKALCLLKQDDGANRSSAKNLLKGILNNPNFSNTDKQAIQTMIAFAK